jgi:hypothetical protein
MAPPPSSPSPPATTRWGRSSTCCWGSRPGGSLHGETVGIVGLGRMGANMARRLARGDAHERHEVVTVPDAGRIGLGEAAAATRERTPERRVVHRDRGVQRRFGRPQRKPPVSLRDLDASRADAPKERREQRARDHVGCG